MLCVVWCTFTYHIRLKNLIGTYFRLRLSNLWISPMAGRMASIRSLFHRQHFQLPWSWRSWRICHKNFFFPFTHVSCWLQAIELAAESLANVKFIQEKKLIGRFCLCDINLSTEKTLFSRYFDEISQDTGKYCFGVDDTLKVLEWQKFCVHNVLPNLNLKALEMGAVETLICWENLDIQRVSASLLLSFKSMK